MKKHKLTALLLTVVCAATFLFPAALAADAAVKASSIEQKNGAVELTYDLNNTDFAKASGISDEIRSQVRKAGRMGDSRTTVSASSRKNAQKMLGVSFVNSPVFDAMQKPDDIINYAEGIEVSFTPTLKITHTNYRQYRQQNGTCLALEAMTQWDEKPVKADTYLYTQNEGASCTETAYTAPDGRTYLVYTVQNGAGQVLSQYTMFQYGNTNYTLWANSAVGLQQDLLFSVLDSMEFPV